MNPSNDLIFVSIASYRDLQLAPTITDCICKANRPERLRFGICWQHGEEENSLPFLNDHRFRVRDILWQESKGACWARAQVMTLWQGETWFLQVDSHCRFAPGWDEILPRMMESTGSQKPILSTYATPFTPGENEVLTGGPLKIAFQAFNADGVPQLKPAQFPDFASLDKPVKARFLAAGFLFAQGTFVEEVPYDPALYFMGEEIAMTVRAFTHGYDLFHPIQTVVWHDYVRTDAKKHWGDHTESNNIAQAWGELEDASKRRIQRLLREENLPGSLEESLGRFGLGSNRTLVEYEAYAGLSFRHRKAQQYTINALDPPNPKLRPEWTNDIHPWIVRVRMHRSQLPDGALDDPAIWNLSIKDEAGNEIFRIDLTREMLAPLYSPEQQIALICEFHSGAVPTGWMVWPLSHSKGWLHAIAGELAEDDFAILKDDE